MSKINNTEQQFEYWLDELIKQGYVISYEREPKTFLLTKNIGFSYNKETKLKTKTKVENKIHFFLKDITYTPDYKVVFSEKALGKYVIHLKMSDTGYTADINSFDKYSQFLTLSENDNGYIVYFDVKPPAFVSKFSAKVGSSREFPIKQRLMFDIHNIYVNKVVPVGSKNCLFNKTFKPIRNKT